MIKQHRKVQPITHRIGLLNPSENLQNCGNPQATSSATLLVALTLLALIVIPAFPPETWVVPDWRDPARALKIPLSKIAWIPFNGAWALEGYHQVSAWLRILLMGALAAALWCLPLRQTVERTLRHLNLPGPSGAMVLLALLPVLLIVHFPVDYEEAARWFGDCDAVVADLDRGVELPAELLMSHAVAGIREVLFSWGLVPPGSLAAMIIATNLSGLIFSLSLAGLAVVVGRTFAERAILLLAGAIGGTAIQFMAYFETTFLVVALVPLFMAFIARDCRTGEALDDKSPWTYLATATAGLIVLSHAAGVAILPALALHYALRKKRKIALGLGVPSWLQCIGFLLLIVYPFYLLLVVRHFNEMSYGNWAGGGDGVGFTPFFLTEDAGGLVFYSVLSPLQLLDIANALLVVSPTLVPLLLLVVIRWRALTRLELWEKKILLVFALMAAGCASVTFLWNHDFSMWGDWNLVSTYMLPTHILLWVTVLWLARHDEWLRGFLHRNILFLILLQLIGFFGLYFQLIEGRWWEGVYEPWPLKLPSGMVER